MAYYLKQREPVGSGIKRIAFEQTGKALHSIDRHEDVHEAIHDVRKRLKKLRALLRLVRDDTGKAFYKKWNVFYRDTGRQLAALRDAHKHTETYRTLAEKYAGEIPAGLQNHLPAWLEEQKNNLVDEKLKRGDMLEQVKNELINSRKDIQNWPVSEELTFGVVAPGLKRVYKRGLKACAAAVENPDAAHYHEFRKRAKYLWYHVRLLKMMWPELLRRLARENHRLATLLGDDHDLMVLQQTLTQVPSVGRDRDHPLNRIIHRESAALRQNIHGRAARIYAEKAGRFSRRMAEYRAAWLSEDD